MFIVYVLPHASLCGGVKVIAEHVTGLAARGHRAEVWGLSGTFNWFPRRVPFRTFASLSHLGESLRAVRGAKVATFWVTAAWVAGNLQPGETGYYLIQDEDELTYGGSDAGASYRLGLVPITEGEFVTEEITRKYGTAPTNVGIGIDPAVFRPLPFLRNRYRVLTLARPDGAGLKGWDITHETIMRLARTVPGVALTTYGQTDPPRIPGIVHQHHRAPSDAQLRDLYSSCGVFLSTSRHEGFGLPMLEAMACGCPVVCTDAHGNREFCRPGDTALVGATPDELAGHLADLIRDLARAAGFRERGQREAARYRWEPVVTRLENLYAARYSGTLLDGAVGGITHDEDPVGPGRAGVGRVVVPGAVRDAADLQGSRETGNGRVGRVRIGEVHDNVGAGGTPGPGAGGMRPGHVAGAKPGQKQQEGGKGKTGVHDGNLTGLNGTGTGPE